MINTFALTAGKSVTLSAEATAKSPAKGTPTGKVTFKDGAKVLGKKPLVNGKATLEVNSFTTGIHNLKAIYEGDGDYNESTSASLTLQVKPKPSDKDFEPGEIAAAVTTGSLAGGVAAERAGP